MSASMPNRPTLLRSTPPPAPTFSQTVARQVRSAFESEGLNSVDLARVLGRSYNLGWSRWTGRRSFTVNEIDRVAQFLGVSLAALVDVRSTAPRAAR